MAKTAELELALRPLEAQPPPPATDGSGDPPPPPTLYAVEMTSSPADSDSDERVSGKATIDAAALRANLTADAYGRALGQALFADPNLRDGFARARAQAQAAQAKLRIRLLLDPSAPDAMHTVHWETLRDDKGAELFNGPNVWFSRYLASTNWEPVHSRAAAGLKALVVIASPTELAGNPNGLAPIPVADEKAAAEAALGEILSGPPVVLANIEGADGKPTVAEIMNRLEDGFDILYMVCHGALLKGEPRLWLEKDDGTKDIVPAANLVAALARVESGLRLIVLASCESAGTQASAEALTALGPRLAAAGVPAVMAMLDKVSMAMLLDFMPKFFTELARDGQIDRAMSAARGYSVLKKYADYWMPALFMRLRSGSLWYQAGFGGSDELDQWKSIRAAVEDNLCTPILGPGMTEDIVGSTREIASQIATKNGFPLAPWSLEDLPTVMQFLSVNQAVRDRNTEYPRRALQVMMRDGLIAKYDKQLSAGCDRTNLNAVLSEVGEIRRATRKFEQHAVLAQKPFSIYLTVNPDEMMEDALRKANRTPRSDFARWNETIADVTAFPTLRDQDPNYRPNPQQPLVYHLYGMLRYPESLVVTEDDYFDYLLRIGSKADGKNLAPSAVGTALAGDALLFVGFRLDDWSFRVLLRSIYSKEGSGARSVGGNNRPCVGAQLMPDKGRIIEPEGAKKYFEKYLRSSNIEIFWGRVDDFVRELDRQTAGLTVPPLVAKAS